MRTDYETIEAMEMQEKALILASGLRRRCFETSGCRFDLENAIWTFLAGPTVAVYDQLQFIYWMQVSS